MPLEIEIRERFRFYQLSWDEKDIVINRLGVELSRRNEILLAVIYGSFLKEYPFRDIDVAVYIRGGIDPLDYKFDLDEALTDKLGYKVDTRILNYAPPWYIEKVLSEGRVILERIPLLLEKLLLKSIDEDRFLSPSTQYNLD